MKMRKILAFVLVVAMTLTLCLTGCGGNNSSPASAPSNSNSSTNTPSASTESGEGWTPNPADYELIDVAHFDKAWNIDSGKLGTYHLDLSTHDPATSMKAMFLEEWAKLIREATNGGVDISVYVGATLASPGDAFSAVEMGTCDMAWIIGSNFCDAIPATGMFYLPGLGLGENVKDCAIMWDMYDKYPAMQQEYVDNNLKLLHLYTTGGVAISGANITTLDDIKGKNIRTTGGYAADIVSRLGGSPISMGPGDMYDALSKGVIDSIAIEWSGIKTFRAYEVCDYYNNTNLWVTVMGLIMNLDSYNSLPAEYQEVIDYYSGREMSMQQAYLWGVENQNCREELSTPEQNIGFTDEEYAKITTICEEYSREKATEISTSDFDAVAFLEDIYASVDAYSDYVYYRQAN